MGSGYSRRGRQMHSNAHMSTYVCAQENHTRFISFWEQNKREVKAVPVMYELLEAVTAVFSQMS